MPNNQRIGKKLRTREADTESREFQNISQRAALRLSREEGFDVDLKRSLSGLESDDLVSFANSKNGGTILIGVDEAEDDKGRQKAVVVGCQVGDRENPVNVHRTGRNNEAGLSSGRSRYMALCLLGRQPRTATPCRLCGRPTRMADARAICAPRLR
jgi:hypothetical protein